jgi:Putative Flp pilus-assembly TadE/G-like
LLSWFKQKPRTRGELGQVIVLMALLLSLFMGFAAFAIDGAHLFVQKKHIQNVADAAALAAARDLPFDGANCGGNYQTSGTCAYTVSQDATTYSNYNGGPNTPFPPCSGPSDTNCYAIHYGSASSQSFVQVRITETPDTFILGALGIGGPVRVSGSAAATPTPLTQKTIFPGVTSPATTLWSTSTITNVTGGANAVLFAKNPSCSGGSGIVDQTGGSGDTIQGAALSNGNFTSSSKETYKGTVYYGSGALCSKPTSGTFLGSPPTQKLASSVPYPTTWDLAAICAGPGVVKNVTTAITLSGPITNGIYCSTVSIDDQSNTTHSVTLIAPSIKIDGNTQQRITPFTQNLLAGANKSCATAPCGTGVTVSVNNTSVVGDIYAPQQDVLINGNALSVSFIEAYDIKITTNGFALTGDGPLQGATTTSTVTSTISQIIPAVNTPPTTLTSTTGTSVGLNQ